MTFFAVGEGNEGDEGDEGDGNNEGNEGNEGDEGNEGNEGNEGDLSSPEGGTWSALKQLPAAIGKSSHLLSSSKDISIFPEVT